MSAPSPGGRPRQLLERRKELEHAHIARPGRERLRSGVGLALSLRFVRNAVAGLFRPVVIREPVSVAHPPAGALAVTFVGHATVLLSTPSLRILIDPCFAGALWGLRRAEAACLHAADRDSVDVILISHAHRDHLHRPSLKTLPRSATIVVPTGCARFVEDLGFANVVVLEPGGTFSHRDIVVTAVAAHHDGTSGFAPWQWRAACGYVVSTPDVTAYYAGDTGYFSGFADIGERMRPDVALLPIAGYEPLPLRDTHMSPLDAVLAFQDLRASVLVPVGYGAFPFGYEPLAAPLGWLRELCTDRGIVDRLATLEPGQTCLVRRPPRPLG